MPEENAKIKDEQNTKPKTLIKNLEFYDTKLKSDKISFFKIFEEQLITIKMKLCHESDLVLGLSSLKIFSENNIDRQKDQLITLIAIEDFTKFSSFIEQLYNENTIYRKFINYTKIKLKLKKRKLQNMLFYVKKHLSKLATKISLQQIEIKDFEKLYTSILIDQEANVETSAISNDYNEKYDKLSHLVKAFKAFREICQLVELFINESDNRLKENNQKIKSIYTSQILGRSDITENSIKPSKTKIGSLLIGLSLIKKYDQYADIFLDIGKIWCGGNTVHKLMDEKEKEIMMRHNWIIDEQNDNRWVFKP